MDKLDCHLNVVARHAHLCTFRKLANACNVCCSEVELRTIVVEERCMTAALVFSKNVNLSCEFLVALYRTRFNKALSSLDFSSLNTTKKSTDVITSLSLIKKFTEHLDTSYNCLTSLLVDTNDLNLIVEFKSTTLYTACSNCTTTCDCEYILDRHKERLICVTNRVRNVAVNSVHKLHNLVAPLAHRILKSLKSRTLDDRSVVARELILVKKISDLHLYELKKLRIVNHIALVHEYYDVRYAYLTGKQDVLSCLSHNTISSSYNEDSTIHLSSTSDHVLYIVSMAWAVNVCIVSLLCLVLNVCSRDSDSTLSLFRSFIDVLEICSCITCNSCCKNFCDCCC